MSALLSYVQRVAGVPDGGDAMILRNPGDRVSTVRIASYTLDGRLRAVFRSDEWPDTPEGRVMRRWCESIPPSGRFYTGNGYWAREEE